MALYVRASSVPHGVALGVPSGAASRAGGTASFGDSHTHTDSGSHQQPGRLTASHPRASASTLYNSVWTSGVPSALDVSALASLDAPGVCGTSTSVSSRVSGGTTQSTASAASALSGHSAAAHAGVRDSGMLGVVYYAAGSTTGTSDGDGGGSDLDFGIGITYLSDLDEEGPAASMAQAPRGHAHGAAPALASPDTDAAATRTHVRGVGRRPAVGMASGPIDAAATSMDASHARGGSATRGKRRRGDSVTAVEQRREWNRENARKSRARKKFVLESLLSRTQSLVEENDRLRRALQVEAPDALREFDGNSGHSRAAPVPAAHGPVPGLHAVQFGAVTTPVALEDADYDLMRTVSRCSHHFIITDPLAPDNPIVFASQGFYMLTGYAPSDIFGFNCRFLQGRDTDPRTVARLRHAVHHGEDIQAVILNYKKDGTPFWNNLFMAPLKNARGQVVHFVGVQAEVPAHVAKVLLARQASADAAFDAAVPHDAQGRLAPAVDQRSAFLATLAK